MILTDFGTTILGYVEHEFLTKQFKFKNFIAPNVII